MYNNVFHMALTFPIVITDFPTPVETTKKPVETTHATEGTRKTTTTPIEISTAVPTTVGTTEKPTDITDVTKNTMEPVTSTPNNITGPPGLNVDFRYFVLCLILLIDRVQYH